MTARLNLVRRLLHWVVAIFLIGMVPAGLVFTDFDNRGWIEAVFGTGQFDALYNLHKGTGIVVLALVLSRIGARLVWPAPRHSPPLPLPQRLAAGATHAALYVLMVATPVLGWLGTGAFPAPMPVWGLFEMPALIGPDRELAKTLLHWHGLCAFALAAIAVVHVAAALYHRNVRQDTVFQRIALFGGGSR
jgi:cytochrome b561